MNRCFHTKALTPKTNNAASPSCHAPISEYGYLQGREQSRVAVLGRCRGGERGEGAHVGLARGIGAPQPPRRRARQPHRLDERGKHADIADQRGDAPREDFAQGLQRQIENVGIRRFAVLAPQILDAALREFAVSAARKRNTGPR